MIDIHCHILPSVDDGASSMTDSIEMARAAADQGITAIIATPHNKNGKYDTPIEIVEEKVHALNKELNHHSIPITVFPGHETRIFGEMLEEYRAGNVLTLNGSQYVFIEFPSQHVPRYAGQMIYDLKLEGLSPIIVHPERNQELISDPDRLYKLVEKGALTQVTAASVTGHFGKKIKKFTNQLIEHNLTHFIASDAHNTSSRGFHLRDAYETVEKEFSISYRYMFEENTTLLMDNKAIFPEFPERIKKKKFLGIF
ncbi:tyrosine-protein phosphatase [Bacillus marinisedimentorum]|uniref:tyrosine-protein phosphatase n=1 Tax=Bacillus marinisedimentorum TaxID=1821260 RepID=UPI0007E0F1EA|nr:CpsB/CapC family capsule biosynthesis tyrosine phosphatase [Bacillus marinisedimentorum]